MHPSSASLLSDLATAHLVPWWRGGQWGWRWLRCRFEACAFLKPERGEGRPSFDCTSYLAPASARV